MYQKRFYRENMQPVNLINFTVKILETDLHIAAESDLSKVAIKNVYKYRKEIEKYIIRNPEFLTSLVPLENDPTAPSIVQHMLQASAEVNVGPMATVAGAIAHYVGQDMLNDTNELIIENGGDVFIKTQSPRKMGVYAGKSSFAGKLVLDIAPSDKPMGICTSAGTLGHSLSLGQADAVVVRSNDTLLADGAATAIGNMIRSESDIATGIDFAQQVEGIDGVLIIIGSQLGVWGNIKFVEV